MGDQNFALKHEVAFPRTGGEKYSTIIALHGRGSNSSDLLGLAFYLKLNDVLVVSPQAPFEMSGGGGGHYAWYQLYEIGEPHKETFVRSVDLLGRFVDEVLVKYPVDKSRLFLMGFSQGAVMSYALSLSNPRKLKGVMAASGYIPRSSELEFKLEELDGLSYFISHGSKDTLIPVSFGRDARDLLSKTSARVTYKEYEMSHELSQETLRDMSVWFKDQVKLKG